MFTSVIHIFLTTDGNYISHTQITTLFKRICREAEIKLDLTEGCHIHMTRHTGITRLIEFDMNLLTISTFSSHTDITQIQETYGHILDDYKNAQINNPNKNYSKEDLFTPDVFEALNNIYK